MLAWTADEGANPVIPTHWEFTVIGVGVLALVLFVLVLIDIARSRRVTGLVRAVWVLVVLVFPVVGSLLWLLVGRRSDAPVRPHGR